MVTPDLGLASVPVFDQAQLPRSCQTFKCRTNGREQTVYIVGTAHTSSASCDDVRAVIREVKPEIVMLELCAERRDILTMQKQDAMTAQQAFSCWRKGQNTAFHAAWSYVLGQIGDAVDVMPGEEFRVAVQEAGKVGASVMLGDRRLHITLARVWASLSLRDKVKLMYSLAQAGLSPPTKEEVENMKESDELTAAIQELGEEFPSLVTTLIHERDQYMVSQLRFLTQRASRIVAVVGAGHLPGMRDRWDEDIDLESICKVPEKRQSKVQWGRLLIVSAATGSLFWYGTMLRRR